MMSLALPPRLGQQLLRPRYCSSWRSRPARVHRAICVSATSCLVVAGAAASSLRQHARYWRWAQYPRRRQRSGLSRQPNSVVRSAAAAAFRVPSGDYEAMNELLDEHGVAILSNVVSPMEVESVKTLIWDWLIEQGVNRLEPSTWSMTAGGWPQDNDNTGIVCRGGAGQSLASWTVRSLPAVQAAFAAIWNTDDLLSSMDGLIIWRPWQSKPAGVLEEWKTRGSWLHADQNPRKWPDRLAVQGLVALTAANPEETGGFVCVPGSHRPESLQKLIERYGGDRLRKRGDFIPISEDDPLVEQTVALPVQPGDLVLFDSRLVHGSEPAPGFEGAADLRGSGQAAKLDLLRMAVPVCMVARQAVEDAEALHAWRLDAVARGVTTKHWPHKMRSQGQAAGPNYRPPQFTEAMRRVF
eukprot:TRINITY_DN52927_c0_g1_i1.p1 TRINITY_DN52927_c0_g1~~TRINITY_DN52927_c0_g1_i1.p1  ORF type:complete len:411 (-),score=77.51 TRINITY_DN52927_c0_g1_i1:608-1840(-)